MKIYYAIFCLITISVCLVRCQDTNKVENKPCDYMDEHIVDSSENQVDRVKAIQKCASCHQEEYKNWLIGPHANAYKSLVEHVKYANSSDNFSDSYKKHLSKSFPESCISCHAGRNLYETVYKGLDSESNPNHFTTEFYPKMANIFAFKRRLQLSTGVDCLTCHKSGDKIVTNSSYIKKERGVNKNNCTLVASKYFSTNSNCLPCHDYSVNPMKELVSKGIIKNEISCNSCHMEYNDKGKVTHYYFWRKDAPGKKRPEKLNLFSDIFAEIRSTNGKQQLFFHWGNNYIPHYYTICADVVAIVELRDKKNKLLLEFSEISNNKEAVVKLFDLKHTKEGISGNPLIMNDKPIERIIPIPETLKGGKIIIRGMYKEQYWSDKKELKEVFKKEILID